MESLMATLEDYLTVKEAAEYLGCSPNTLRNWGRDGKVTMHRNPINGYRLFKVSDLDKLLKKIGTPSVSPRNASKRKPK